MECEKWFIVSSSGGKCSNFSLKIVLDYEKTNKNVKKVQKYEYVIVKL